MRRNENPDHTVSLATECDELAAKMITYDLGELREALDTLRDIERAKSLNPVETIANRGLRSMLWQLIALEGGPQ